jgi:3-deoxy-manno-octulosonate cytidylyltransferase (CMP-KDO synthetase)
MKTLGIIPARFASTRFPGKPLALLAGKPIIQWVWERARESNVLDRVIVATDDARILEVVEAFGGEAVLTRSNHPSGTDRCAEVLAGEPTGEWTWVCNVQGDEPFLDPAAIDQLGALLRSDAQPGIATLARPIEDAVALTNPNVVKVAVGQKGNALYFSRHPVPFVRGADPGQWLERYGFLQHIGLYGFRADVLPQLTALPPSPLEQAESLEQLRWLEHGFPIAVGITRYTSIGIDTPEDLKYAQLLLAQQ